MRPAGQRCRLGSAGATAGVSGDAGQGWSAGGLTLPRQVRMPWEAQAGIAVQIGGRPLNRTWVNPHDDEKSACARDAGAARARACASNGKRSSRTRACSFRSERELPVLPGWR